MQAWFYFWMIAIGISAVLFFGIAILVAIFGWRDLRDLYQELQSQHKPDQDPPAINEVRN
jgi:hypothetical protein